jgi:crossover junction endodeoxyribonuclease RuvC
MLKVIGVDPGTITTGWGVIEKSGNQITYIKSGIINIDSNLKTPAKLHFLFENLKKILDQFRPTALALENIFYSKNIQSTLRLGEARGIIMLCSAERDIKIYEYPPTNVKLSVTGNGHASKEQIEIMVRRLLKVPETIKGDEADALAIALCHIYNRKI